MQTRPAIHAAGPPSGLARHGHLAVLALAVTACGVLSAEEQLLTDFFEASRLHDTTTVSRMSSVTFNPRSDGIVQAFEVEDAAGDGTSRTVSVRATVRQPDGVVADRQLVFTLLRKDDRWFITAIDGQASGGP